MVSDPIGSESAGSAESTGPSPMQTVIKSLAVVEAVADGQPIGVSQLARIVGLPKSTVQRMLATLAAAGWVAPLNGDTARWVLTSRPLRLAQRAGGDTGLREAARPFMTELRDSFDETIYMVIREGDWMVTLDRLDSYQSVRTYLPLGSRSPIYAGAVGRAVLAFLPPAEQDEILARGVEPLTPTMPTAPALRAQLIEIRDRGYSVINGDWRPHTAALGAAVFDEGRVPVGGLSVSMPDVRFSLDRAREIGPALVLAADGITAAVIRGDVRL